METVRNNNQNMESGCSVFTSQPISLAMAYVAMQQWQDLYDPDLVYGKITTPDGESGKFFCQREYLSYFLSVTQESVVGKVCPFDGVVPHREILTGTEYDQSHTKPAIEPVPEDASAA